MSAPRRIDLSAIPPQRWKNGAGLTREIAAWPRGAGIDDFEWRLSVADLERDAPFSAFPGVDRCIVVLDGAGMQLLDDRGECVQALRPLEPWSFEGERVLHASLPHGACRDFNVMARCGHWRAAVDVWRQRATVAAADATVLVALTGRWRVADQELAPLQALLWEAPHETLTAEALDANAVLLHCRLCHDRQP
ncbi:MAG: HutD family protein [Piscinibacter sp.]|uniref:HutD/Ves family protein n=1 Tax=Piscinibacter sp. TaxID=1903157 RepID=UPI003D13A556